MATYTRIPKTVPSYLRVTKITDVAAGDQIDLVSILGKPAAVVQLHVGTSTEIVEYRLNSHVVVTTVPDEGVGYTDAQKLWGVKNATTASVWLDTDAYPVFSSTGAEVLEIGEGLKVSSIEIISIDTAPTITIVAW